jgi:hypothetical protein
MTGGVPACTARTSGPLVELPEINGRDDPAQVLNGWGEVTANIHERNVPRQLSGTFGRCLKGTKVALPAGTQRIWYVRGLCPRMWTCHLAKSPNRVVWSVTPLRCALAKR